MNHSLHTERVACLQYAMMIYQCNSVELHAVRVHCTGAIAQRTQRQKHVSCCMRVRGGAEQLRAGSV